MHGAIQCHIKGTAGSGSGLTAAKSRRIGRRSHIIPGYAVPTFKMLIPTEAVSGHPPAPGCMATSWPSLALSAALLDKVMLHHKPNHTPTGWKFTSPEEIFTVWLLQLRSLFFISIGVRRERKVKLALVPLSASSLLHKGGND